jgi:hypothetical protein
MLVLAVDLHCNDGSPGLFRSQYSQVLGPENWKRGELEEFICYKVYYQ